jgi:2'-5' RNA ligase
VELSRKPSLNVSRRTVIAYWLIPTEPAHSFFERIITDLAHRYDAPVFEPHMTIHVGANHMDLAETALEHAARECTRIRLTPIRIDQSEEFIKTLFVQFALSEELRQMSQIIRQAAHDSSQYELKPHLSLLYKNIAAETRRELAASITLPFSEIIFDSIQAVRCVSPTQATADVELWRLIAARAFSG